VQATTNSQERADFNKRQKKGLVQAELEVTQPPKTKPMVTVTNLYQRLRKFGLEVEDYFLESIEVCYTCGIIIVGGYEHR
jgi:hypothetical protein